jgi:hypothetical protein
MGEDALNQPWLLDAGDHPERAAAVRTALDVNKVN